MSRLLILIALVLSACSGTSGEGQSTAELQRLDSALTKAEAAAHCTALAPEESAIVLPQLDCSGCVSITAQLLEGKRNAVRVFAAGRYQRHLTQELGGQERLCITPYGLEDYGLDAIRVPTLLRRSQGKVVELIELNGIGRKHLKELGMLP